MRAGFRGRFGWAMFDWAAQPFFTIITTFIFAPYFASQIIGDQTEGQETWGWIQGGAGLVMAFAAPVLGALADATGPRKPWTVGFSLLCAVACCGLWFAEPGATGPLYWFIVAMVVLGVIGAEFAVVFNNAMLPSLAGEDRVGGLSGFGWAMGYIGALVALPIMLWLTGQLPGIPGPGFDMDSHVGERLSGPFAGIWYAVFLIPFMLWTPDQPRMVHDRVAAVRKGLRDLRHTLATLPSRPNIFRFLISRMIYYDGLNAIFAFGGIYIQGQLGWGLLELGLFGILTLVFGIPGSFLGGWLDDRIGSRPTLFLSLTGLVLTVLAIISIGDGKVFFVVPLDFPVEGDGLFAAPAEWAVLGITALLGIVAGPAQAASRSMVARLAPPDQLGKYYGLFALSGKATSWAAPLTIALVTRQTESARIGISMILVFIVVGLVLLLRVREVRDPG
ncbi:MAG: MFS transporter [Pseudomonadota bacterium]|nr:MFS transporter [Pseudomonadota bacterium]